jgi:hypothetical protein
MVKNGVIWEMPVNTGWQRILQDLNRRLNYRKLKVLFSDGGPRIEENLSGAGMKPQRCLWHGQRDSPYHLYADGVKKGKRGSLVEKLKSIPALQLGLKSCGTPGRQAENRENKRQPIP